MPNLASDVSGGIGKGIAPLVRGRPPSLPHGSGSQHRGGVRSSRNPFFQYLRPFGSLWPRLFAIFHDIFRNFGKTWAKHLPPSYVLSKKYVILVIFPAPEHQKALKTIENPKFFQCFCWFHSFRVFSLLASILAKFSEDFNRFCS